MFLQECKSPKTTLPYCAGDMIADVAMAKRGSPRMGFSAAFGGPLFNMLLGIGLPFTIQILGSGKNVMLGFDSMTAVLAIGLAVSLTFSYVLLPILNFKVTVPHNINTVLHFRLQSCTAWACLRSTWSFSSPALSLSSQ